MQSWLNSQQHSPVCSQYQGHDFWYRAEVGWPLSCSVRKHIVLKGLLKQPALLAWLLETRAAHRAAAGLGHPVAAQPLPAGALQGADVLRAGTAEQQRRNWMEEAEAVASACRSCPRSPAAAAGNAARLQFACWQFSHDRSLLHSASLLLCQ